MRRESSHIKQLDLPHQKSVLGDLNELPLVVQQTLQGKLRVAQQDLSFALIELQHLHPHIDVVLVAEFAGGHLEFLPLDYLLLQVALWVRALDGGPLTVLRQYTDPYEDLVLRQEIAGPKVEQDLPAAHIVLRAADGEGAVASAPRLFV